MFIFSILLRATALVVAGYFVWFAASRSEERLKSFGKYLALWTFVIAGLYVIASIATPYMGMGRFGGRTMGPAAMRMHPGFAGGFGPGMMMHRASMRGFMFRRNRAMGTSDQNSPNQNNQNQQPAQPAPAPSK
jgi:hypothetical protein